MRDIYVIRVIHTDPIFGIYQTSIHSSNILRDSPPCTFSHICSVTSVSFHIQFNGMFMQCGNRCIMTHKHTHTYIYMYMHFMEALS